MDNEDWHAKVPSRFPVILEAQEIVPAPSSLSTVNCQLSNVSGYNREVRTHSLIWCLTL